MLFSSTLNGNWVTMDMEENLGAKISYSLLWKYEKIVTCKRDPEARDETETFDFQSETRPRGSHISTRLRRDRDVGKMRLETVSRPRRRDRDYIPDRWHQKMIGACRTKRLFAGKTAYWHKQSVKNSTISSSKCNLHSRYCCYCCCIGKGHKSAKYCAILIRSYTVHLEVLLLSFYC